MKKLIFALALGALIGTPALAQSYDPELGTANVSPMASVPQEQSGLNAYAQAPGGRMHQRSRAVDPAPDANLQFQLHRESQEGY